MSKKNTPRKTRQKTLFFAAMFVGFLGTGIFAGISGFHTYETNQTFSNIEEDLSFIHHQIRAEYQGTQSNQGVFFKNLERLSSNATMVRELFREKRDTLWTLTIFASTTSLCLLLFTLFSLRQLQKIGWKGNVSCYFSDEVVGELIAFRRELTKAGKSPLSIETKLLYEVLTLIWAFYIQINIENLWLPSKDQRRR